MSMEASGGLPFIMTLKPKMSVFIYIFILFSIFPSLFADKYCGKPPDVKNGEANLQGYISEFPVGTNISYTCFDGYSIRVNESSFSVCLNDSDTTFWQPAVISCESVCSHLPILKHGRLQLDGQSVPFMPGESIRYICDAGYLPDLRNPKITCMNEDGVANWTRTENACKISIVSCNDPGYIENADRIGNVFTFPHNITYICSEGFRMIGTATRYCSPKGQWLPKAPVCEAIICPFLSELQNGKVISSRRDLHAVARYECDRYFKLSGNSERTCQEDGTWTGDVPICKEITCLDPGAIQHVRVIPTEPIVRKAGDLVIFKCKYAPHQTSSKCLETGEWSRRPPVCPGPSVPETVPDSTLATTSTETYEQNLLKSSCDDPGKIKNGETIFAGLNINSTVTYTCEDGYELRGKGTLVCLENGKWDLDKLPICVKPISIPSIIGIVFGVLILVALVVGAYFWYRWRERKLRGYGEKSKALTADATDLEEIAGLEKMKKPIPVTVL